MPARKMSCYSRPLGSENKDGGTVFIDFVPMNHWALVVGEPAEILFEIFPITGDTFLTPRNTLSVCRKSNILTAKLSLFTRFGPWLDTELTDEEILEKAKEIIKRNPIYNILLENCQNFVDRLRWEIKVKSVWEWVKPPFMFRGQPSDEHMKAVENLDVAVDYETDVYRRVTAAKGPSPDQSDEVVPSPNMMDLERNKLQITSVNAFLTAQGLPQLEELLSIWALHQYRDMAQKAEVSSDILWTPEPEASGGVKANN